MKNNLHQILLLFFIGFLFYSCEKEDLKTYSGEDNIYFDWSVAGRTPETIDSISVSFAFDELDVIDRIVQVPVSLQGNVSEFDREYKIKVDESSTAIEEEHFSFEEKTILKAGQVIDTLPIKLYRTSDMQENRFSIVMELLPNENFSTGMRNISEEGLSFVRLTITVDDILDRPPGWDDLFLGRYSREKLFLMVEVLGIGPDTFLQGIPLGDLMYYNSFMKRYLDQQKAEGNTVYEEDGSEMEMGPGLPFFG